RQGGHHDHGRGEDRLHRGREGVRPADRSVGSHPHGRNRRGGRLKASAGPPLSLDAVSVRTLRTAGFADPRAALANLHALTPTPRDAELLAPSRTRLPAELSVAADPDMALNNLERYAGGVDRSVFFTTLAAHPGAATLLATIGGSSQMLADTLRRHPQLLAWLL